MTLVVAVSEITRIFMSFPDRKYSLPAHAQKCSQKSLQNWTSWAYVSLCWFWSPNPKLSEGCSLAVALPKTTACAVPSGMAVFPVTKGKGLSCDHELAASALP